MQTAIATAATVATCRRLMARAQAATRLKRQWRARAYRHRPATLRRRLYLAVANHYCNVASNAWEAYSNATLRY